MGILANGHSKSKLQFGLSQIVVQRARPLRRGALDGRGGRLVSGLTTAMARRLAQSGRRLRCRVVVGATPISKGLSRSSLMDLEQELRCGSRDLLEHVVGAGDCGMGRVDREHTKQVAANVNGNAQAAS